MARSLVLGNGSMLLGFDQYALLRDFYYEYVGLDNHMSDDAVHLLGVWVEGELSFLNSGEWVIDIAYVDDTMSGVTVAKNERLMVELEIIDQVYNEKNIYLRKVKVTNRAKAERLIKLFFNFQFHMYGIKKKDTVYFDPQDNTIVHYKGRRIAVIGGTMDGAFFEDYSVGLSSLEGKEGTWKDAEDGVLSKNPIEHGSVDSTIGFAKLIQANASFEVESSICIGKTFKEVKDLNRYVINKGAHYLIESSQDFWHAWINKSEINFGGLEEKIQSLFKKSLLILRTHADNTGAIIASGDSDLLRYGRDSYSYVWTRDASVVAIALDMAGYSQVSQKYFEFANDVISDDGYFFHRYRCDKSLGSSWHPWIVDGRRQLPIQEDETAIVLIALWNHYSYTRDLEFIESVYNSLIKRAANFMLGFRNELKLPFPSYDLWEMKFGIHAFTAASTCEALKSAARFAKLLGKEKDERFFTTGAAEVEGAVKAHFFSDKTNYFYKFIDLAGAEILHDETLDTSSFYGMFHFEIYAPDDPIMLRALETLKKKLVCQPSGGLVRFENDEYFRVNFDFPGNPWMITSMWLAQYYLKLAKTKGDLSRALDLINWVSDRALPSGILSEQSDPVTGKQLSASPLTWSHAEYVITVLLYLDKLKDLEVSHS